MFIKHKNLQNYHKRVIILLNEFSVVLDGPRGGHELIGIPVEEHLGGLGAKSVAVRHGDRGGVSPHLGLKFGGARRSRRRGGGMTIGNLRPLDLLLLILLLLLLLLLEVVERSGVDGLNG